MSEYKNSPCIFYYRPKEKPLDKLKVEADFEDQIERIWLGHPRYECRRGTRQLKREG